MASQELSEPQITPQVLHEDIRQNSDLCVAGEREMTHQEQLMNKKAALYQIWISTIPRLDQKLVTSPKPNFLHGDRIDTAIRYVTEYVLSTPTGKANKLPFLREGRTRDMAPVGRRSQLFPATRKGFELGTHRTS